MRTISGYESRSSPYPQRRSFYRGLAPSPIKLTQKRSSRLSQLSFSPSEICSECRGLSSPRSPASLPANSLPGLALSEPRWDGQAAHRPVWPEPRRRISRRAAASPALTDPARACARVCPGRPFSICKERGERSDEPLPGGRTAARPRASKSPMMCMGSNGWITPKSLGLLSRASLALDEPVSWHPALRALEHGG